MDTNDFKTLNLAKEFFKALEEKTLLLIIDTASKNDKAVFSLVSFKEKNNYGYGYRNYAAFLTELGFKNYGKHDDLFVTYCAGRYSLYILDNIGQELKKRGIELPKEYYNWIQYQNHI